MVATYSTNLRRRVDQNYCEGETMRAVANTFNVSVGFVHHVVDLDRRYGLVMDPYVQPRRGHRAQTFANEDYIQTLIEARPSIYFDEIRDELFTEC